MPRGHYKRRKHKTRPPLLNRRQVTHGSFMENAALSQALKGACRHTLRTKWYAVSSVQRESIDNICLKLARIISGMGRKEHWEDVVGYAQLALEDCTD